ncbi:MAG: cyclopropane-fatty-acyl-phospholipid synthase [Rhodocyclaceae bacterium]|nr:cyclopropane-fatty-acyl-phospholipid synthase [Rhodocyclaceae bacterium]
MKPVETTAGQGRSVRDALHILQRIFRDFPGGIRIRLWDGHTVSLGTHAPRFTVIFRDPGKFREMVLYRDPLRLAEAHFSGHVEIEGSIYDVLGLREHFQSLRLSAVEKAAILARTLSIRQIPASRQPDNPSRQRRNWRTKAFGSHSRQTDRHAIAFHYDVSNDFYRLWLDPEMVYSCAYFEKPEDDLDLAQRQKLDHICRKLRLQAGETLLDIGCGWGGLVCWAARHYGVRATGITLSRGQLDYAQEKIRREGLEDRVRVELRDYRDLPGKELFDKVVSVGMFEHVGIRNLPLYFRTAHQLLKPGGVFLNHGITSEDEGWRRNVNIEFINRYVFPDGELETMGNVLRGMEQSGFEIVDVEALRAHYALTLRHWVDRLESRREEAVRHTDEATYRIWRMYMAGCALQFEAGEMGLYQILAARREKGLARVPLTRRDLYPPPSP